MAFGVCKSGLCLKLKNNNANQSRDVSEKQLLGRTLKPLHMFFSTLITFSI